MPKFSQLAALFAAACAVNANDVDDESQNGNVFTVSQREDAIHSAYQKYLSDEDVSKLEYYDLADGVMISGITFPASTHPHSDVIPVGTTFQQGRVASQGEWDQWLPTSRCIVNTRSMDPLTRDIEWFHQVGVTSESSDFDVDLARIEARKLGVEVEPLFEERCEKRVTVPGGTVGQVWTQKHMIWQDQQTQTCSIQEDGPECSAWSAYIHGDLPDDSRVLNAELRVGESNTQCRFY